MGMQMSLSIWDRKGPKRITLKKFDNREDIDHGGFQGYSRIIRSASADYEGFVVEIDQNCYNRYLQLKEKGDTLILNTRDQGAMLRLHIIMVPGDNAIPFVEEMTGLPLESLEVEKVTVYSTPGYSKEQKLVNVLGNEPIPPSPGLMRGLKSANFGVYNYDQTTRIHDPIAITPTYYDSKTG
jgi:hypothetical protein